ncbi:hypothetical protein Y032_0063g3405 [Ancylostoma ceylanicum]|uniref:Uncharacterized protein n=1 Tax=Ancylostoma ceylanicum TaxID=53326 RepID=A0A016U0M2_9BILA|nr:hypothetical protein Y032_0063g3405 [Ancylostoma ceylanicum]
MVCIYREHQSQLPLLRPLHLRGAVDATPNIHRARPHSVSVAAAGVVIVIDVPCIKYINTHNNFVRKSERRVCVPHSNDKKLL